MVRLAHRLATADDTRRFGRALAGLLRPGDLVVLAGRLGAGKTVLAQGIGDGLGVAGAVTSPTFVIARVHRPDPRRGGTVPLVHVDAYRLGAAPDPRGEVDDLDLDATAEESVTVVEWGEGLVEHLAAAHLRVRLDRADGTDSDEAGSDGAGAGDGHRSGDGARGDDGTRWVELAGHGGDWAARLAGPGGDWAAWLAGGGPGPAGDRAARPAGPGADRVRRPAGELRA